MQRRTFLHALALAPLIEPWRAGFIRDAVAATQTTAAQPDVELALSAAPGQVRLLDGSPTQVWQYSARVVRGPAGALEPLEGSYLGPVIRLRRGQRVRVRFANRLAEPSIVHWHGLDVPESADGHPRLAVDGGEEYVYDFEVRNRAGTYWYHPHPHERTGPQVYQGLAGLLIVSDPEEDALSLPSGTGELLCVLQDRRIDAGNQFVYAGAATGGSGGAAGRGMGRGRGRGMAGGMGMRGGMAMMETMNGWLGDRVLVNGRLRPTTDVDRRTYRVRMLNGSNARVYSLGWSDGSPMTIIGADGGLLDRARTQKTLTLGPGQRADLLLDLSRHTRGAEVRLESAAFPAAAIGRVGMEAEPASLPQGAPFTLMTLRASGPARERFNLPNVLSNDAGGPAPPRTPVRRVPLTFMQMNWWLDGRSFDMTDVAPEETVAPGSTHFWDLVNEPNPMGMAMAHPIHLHGRQFRVISRSGGGANALRGGINDAGWTDTVLVLPGETVRIQVTFSDHEGLFLYHCHNLEHEDMGMMRNYRIRRQRS
jgi:FtsP/CotA-like multicopper oxidase with cupredoxin domain